MDGFVPEAWENQLGMHPFATADCDAVSCAGPKGILVRDPNALAMLCDEEQSRLLIVPQISVKSCGAAKVIDRKFLRNNGALSIDEDGTITSVRDTEGVRPWSRFDDIGED